MTRYQSANAQVSDFHVGPGNNEVEDVTGIVCGLRDMLKVSERLQQLVKSHCVDVIGLVDVRVAVAADDKTVARRQSLKDRRRTVSTTVDCQARRRRAACRT